MSAAFSFLVHPTTTSQRGDNLHPHQTFQNSSFLLEVLCYPHIHFLVQNTSFEGLTPLPSWWIISWRARWSTKIHTHTMCRLCIWCRERIQHFVIFRALWEHLRHPSPGGAGERGSIAANLSKNPDFCWRSSITLTGALECRTCHLKGLAQVCIIHSFHPSGVRDWVVGWLTKNAEFFFPII